MDFNYLNDTVMASGAPEDPVVTNFYNTIRFVIGEEKTLEEVYRERKSEDRTVGDEYEDGGDYDFRSSLQAIGSGFKPSDIKNLIACIPGEADGPRWYYLYELKNGNFGSLWSWCDYTGWGCQDGGEEFYSSTLEDALYQLEVSSTEDSTNRNILIQLIRQIAGKQPYGLYETIPKPESLD